MISPAFFHLGFASDDNNYIEPSPQKPMNGNFINDATRKVITELELPKPKSFWFSPAIPTFGLSLCCSIWLFLSDERLAFWLSGIWVMVLTMKIAIDIRLHCLKMELYQKVTRLKEIILTPVTVQEGETTIFTFIGPSAELQDRTTKLTNFFSKP